MGQMRHRVNHRAQRSRQNEDPSLNPALNLSSAFLASGTERAGDVPNDALAVREESEGLLDEILGGIRQ